MIKIFAMDVDGTLTDGKINISDNGELFKSFNAKDGLGIKLLISNNIVPIIITGRNSQIVVNRANEIGLKTIYQNVSNKLECLEEICKTFKVQKEEIAYIGDDVNDLEVLKNVGYSFAPSDAHKDVLKEVKYKCKLEGGKGAVREAIDFILEQNKRR